MAAAGRLGLRKACAVCSGASSDGGAAPKPPLAVAQAEDRVRHARRPRGLDVAAASRQLATAAGPASDATRQDEIATKSSCGSRAASRVDLSGLAAAKAMKKASSGRASGTDPFGKEPSQQPVCMLMRAVLAKHLS